VSCQHPRFEPADKAESMAKTKARDQIKASLQPLEMEVALRRLA